MKIDLQLNRWVNNCPNRWWLRLTINYLLFLIVETFFVELKKGIWEINQKNHMDEPACIDIWSGSPVIMDSSSFNPQRSWCWNFIEIKHFSRCVFWWVGQGIFDRFWKPLTCLTVSDLLLFVLSNILFGELNMVFSSRFSRIMLHRRTFWCGYWLILLCLQHFPRYLITFSSAHLRYSFPEKIFLSFSSMLLQGINGFGGKSWIITLA